jgi:alanine-glyoxylate transaminase/(R)-3-amino-2-methylpropionate-pyruvate transaminase
MKTPELPPFDYTPKPYTGPSAEEVLALRKQFLNPALFLYYQKPMMIVEGKGQYVFDEKGRRYLDGIAGIATVSVGHCHPDVVAAANLQSETLQHATTIYLHPNTHVSSPPKCPAISKSATSSIPAPRPTISRS